MKQSVRAKRMARHHKRLSAQGKLSLVSLMDIFTILVFFLMLNASDVQVLQNDRSLTLPKSSADTAAEEQLLLTVSQQRLMLDGVFLMTLEQVVNTQDDTLSALSKELELRKKIRQQAKAEQSEEDTDARHAITIMGDEAIEYQALKKIMHTCAQAGYSDISLAVEYVEAESGAALEVTQ
ncbi:ExbD/TolR family protein [Alteromonas facilis]|uniref:ExbD/TolR family protein n=1 Tax=Alteromonas facilis TaxID=2048004 RepID=UPI000C290F93|nr:biopolymer transporter ExbD [Alteromonas facilis]